MAICRWEAVNHLVSFCCCVKVDVCHLNNPLSFCFLYWSYSAHVGSQFNIWLDSGSQVCRWHGNKLVNRRTNRLPVREKWRSKETKDADRSQRRWRLRLEAGASISAVKRLCSNRPLGNTCHNSTCRSVPAAAHALSQHQVLCYSDLHSMRTVLDSFKVTLFAFILTSVFILTENLKNTKQYKAHTHRQELYLSFSAHPAKAQRSSQHHPPCCPSTATSVCATEKQKKGKFSSHISRTCELLQVLWSWA